MLGPARAVGRAALPTTVLGLLFLYSSIRAAMSKSRQEAKRLLLASVIYLPLLFILMVVNR